MDEAFSPIRIRNTEIKNRFIRSSTNEQKATDIGEATQELLDIYVKLSEGDIGLIVTGCMYPDPSFQALKNQTGFCTDEMAEKWRSTIGIVHSNGSKIIVQFTHAGPGARLPKLEKLSSCENGRQVTKAEIKQIVDIFVEASVRTEKVGFDGVQLSVGHGFLLSTFLSPLENHRTDEYGGSEENRVRIIREIIYKTRQLTNKDFIIALKINGDDTLEGGVTKELAARYVAMLKDEVDFFEITCGYRSPKNTVQDIDKAEPKQERPVRGEGYNVELAAFIKEKNPDALISGVGGIRTKSFIDGILKAHKVDLISMSRPFIDDPFYLRKLK